MNMFAKFKSLRVIVLLIMAGLILMPASAGPKPNPKPKFKVAWSIYAGWMPWDYAGASGVLKKWADKNGVEIELLRMDYMASIEAYVAGQVDACVMTNMDCLAMPGSSGIDSTCLIIGDYSNGNDALIVRDNLNVKGLKGKEVNLVELSVSHYLLARALEKNGMAESDVKILNVSDSDIGPIFISNKSQKAVVTWNPIVMEIEQTPGVSKIFTSADIPGEIIDMMVVKTETLTKSPGLGKALTGAWYEIMALMSGRGADATKALADMAAAAECSLVEYKAQLKTTAMFYKAQDAVNYGEGAEIKEKMNFVRNFCFKHGLLGENAKSADVIGIQYPDGTVQGNPKAIRLRFDVTAMKQAAENKL